MSVYAVYTMPYYVWLDTLHILVFHYLISVTQPIADQYFYLKKMTLCFYPQVTVENFLRVLTGRIPSSTPRSKRLLSDDRSNILIYMTGNCRFLGTIYRCLLSWMGLLKASVVQMNKRINQKIFFWFQRVILIKKKCL